MKHTLALLTALLHAPLAALYGGQDVPGFPTIGKLRGNFFQPLENRGAMTFH